MLVLTRTVGEEIVIADNIRVRVAEIKGGRIKLAIEAPRHIAVRRREVPAASQPTERELVTVG